MGRWGTIAVAALAGAAGFATAAGGLALRGGISALPAPSALETGLARRVRHLAIPAAAREMGNPVRPSERVPAEAREHFADHCAACHGNDGRGDTALGRALYPRPPDLTAPPTQSLPDGELFYLIESGVRLTGMPGFGGAGRPEESWKLVHLIRRLPGLTEAERQDMERSNPRSPAEWRELQQEEELLRGSGPAPAGAGHQH